MNELLVGETIAAVHADSDVIYIMLNNGTQITINGVMTIETCTYTVKHRNELAFPDEENSSII